MLMFIVAAFFGVLVGVLSGMLGIGGGTIMVPLFRLVFSMEPIMATATSLFTIIPTSISGMWKHHVNKTSLPLVGIVCGLAGACLSPVGVWAASNSPGYAIMGAAALVIVYSSFTMFKKALKAPKFADVKAARAADQVGAVQTKVKQESDALQAGQPEAAQAQPAASQQLDATVDIKFTPYFVGKCVVIGVIAGFMSGYVGVGGGFIMVPLFISLLNIPMRLASGTSLTAVCILAVPGVIEQGLLSNIDYMVGIAMAVGSIPGAVLGANLVRRVPERLLRFIFAGFLLVAAVLLMCNELGVY